MLKLDEPLYFPLCDGRDLHSIAAIIKRAKALVGVESSMLHLANALKVPGFVITGALKTMPWYTLYCGMYRKPENVNFIRYYGCPPMAVPVEPAAYVLGRFLDGSPLTPQECDAFFLKYQVEQMQRGWFSRLCRKLAEPYRRLRATLMFHKRPRR